MNEARFMGLLAAYGADLARWPEDERIHAEVFLEGAPHRIRDVWESERAFDHLLTLERDLPASIALETAILATSPGRRRSSAPVDVLGWLTMPRWAMGGALAASLALGVAVGYAGEPQSASATDYATMLTVSGGGAGSVFLTAMNDTEN